MVTAKTKRDLLQQIAAATGCRVVAYGQDFKLVSPTGFNLGTFSVYNSGAYGWTVGGAGALNLINF